MDREQRGVTLPRFDHHRMQQYHHGGGGGRSRMPSFGRGGAYIRGQKQFNPPPPPPVPVAPLPLPPQRRYEVLMEAGRLAAEYLVAKGVLPPASMQRGGSVVGVGRNQMPPPPLPPAQEGTAFYDTRNGRRQFDDEYNDPIPRSRRNRGSDYNDNNNSNYSGRGKRKLGAYNRNSEWGRERSRDYVDSRNYDGGEEEDGAPGYRRGRRESDWIDDAGEVAVSKMEAVREPTGERAVSKTEAVRGSELEDDGLKESSNSNARKDGNAAQGTEDTNEANEMQEDIKVSNSEAVEQGMHNRSNSCNASSVIDVETNNFQVSSDDKVSDDKLVESNVLNETIEDGETSCEKAEDDKVSDEIASSVENNMGDDCKKFLNYCSFARAPTRPRSILANRNRGPDHRAVAVAEQADPVSHMVIGEAANESSLTNVQGDNKNDTVCQEHTNPTIACNQMVEQVKLQEKEILLEAVNMQEQNNTSQDYALQEKELLALASHQNSLKFQVKEGIPIYNIDTPPQDEDLIDSADEGKTVGVESLPITGVEAIVKMEEEKLGQSSSFKIRDLNLIGSPEIAETRNFGQCSTPVCSMEAHDQEQVDLSNSRLGEKIIQVIDIEDDSPVETGVCDTSKAKNEVVYPSMENMMNPTVNTGALPGIQDGYNLAIPDYLAADMPFQSIQTDLHVEIGPNDSEVITVMDDPIYGSLSDIGFMEVWNQQPPDYEKFF